MGNRLERLIVLGRSVALELGAFMCRLRFGKLIDKGLDPLFCGTHRFLIGAKVLAQFASLLGKPADGRAYCIHFVAGLLGFQTRHHEGAFSVAGSTLRLNQSVVLRARCGFQRRDATHGRLLGHGQLFYPFASGQFRRRQRVHARQNAMPPRLPGFEISLARGQTDTLGFDLGMQRALGITQPSDPRHQFGHELIAQGNAGRHGVAAAVAQCSQQPPGPPAPFFELGGIATCLPSGAIKTWRNCAEPRRADKDWPGRGCASLRLGSVLRFRTDFGAGSGARVTGTRTRLLGHCGSLQSIERNFPHDRLL